MAADAAAAEEGSSSSGDEGDSSVEDENGVDDDEDDGDDEDDDATAGRKAACALCVGVGSLCDPPGLDGLAHFVEHMAFMGTKRYPDENGWSSHLAAHGGEDNGETAAEHTVCYFDVNPAHLRESLDRFVDFFARSFGFEP